MKNQVSVCFDHPVVNRYFRHQSSIRVSIRSSTKCSSSKTLDSHSPNDSADFRNGVSKLQQNLSITLLDKTISRLVQDYESLECAD